MSEVNIFGKEIDMKCYRRKPFLRSVCKVLKFWAKNFVSKYLVFFTR